MSQSIIITFHRDISKLGLENHFPDMDVNGNVLLYIALTYLVRQMIVYAELRWVVFGCFCVFCKQVFKFAFTKIVINGLDLYTLCITFLKIAVKITNISVFDLNV